MFTKTQKALQKKKDKAVIEQQEKIQLNKERILRRVKTEIYPFIKEHTTSIDDATLFLEIVGSTLQQSFIMQMRKMSIKDLGLIEMINDGVTEEEAAKWKGLLNLMEDETVFDMKELLDNMVREIDDQIRKKISKEKTLTDLNIEIYENSEQA